MKPFLQTITVKYMKAITQFSHLILLLQPAQTNSTHSVLFNFPMKSLHKLTECGNGQPFSDHILMLRWIHLRKRRRILSLGFQKRGQPNASENPPDGVLYACYQNRGAQKQSGNDEELHDRRKEDEPSTSNAVKIGVEAEIWKEEDPVKVLGSKVPNPACGYKTYGIEDDLDGIQPTQRPQDRMPSLATRLNSIEYIILHEMTFARKGSKESKAMASKTAQNWTAHEKKHPPKRMDGGESSGKGITSNHENEKEDEWSERGLKERIVPI
jgi:hypothetical protein